MLVYSLYETFFSGRRRPPRNHDLLLDRNWKPSAVREAVAEARLGRQPAVEGHLLDLEAVLGIDLATPLRRRPDTQWSMHVDGEAAALHFHGKAIELPAYAQLELSFIARTDSFTGAGSAGRA